MILVLDLLVHKSSDDRKCVQHQPVYVLFLPSWLVGSPPAARWSHRVPRPAASGLASVYGGSRSLIHPSGLPSDGPRWPVVVVLQVTVLSAHTAVTHSYCAGDGPGEGLPEWTRGFWGGKEVQNLHKAPAGTESDPSCYYHIIWSAWLCGSLVPIDQVGSVVLIIAWPSGGSQILCSFQYSLW